MSLTTAQKQQMFEQGFLHIPQVVPREKVDAALRVINHSVGEGMNVADMPILRAQSYCPEIAKSAEISGLFNETPARQMMESLIGPLLPAKSGQIALRFPVLGQAAPPRPHLDGMYTPTNGVAPGKIQNFSALLGVLLSDLPNRDAGNFTVWPGSHQLHAGYFQKHGPQSLLDGMPKIDIGPPLQITGRAGDIVIAHYLLGHTAASNVSPHVRYAIFFRLSQPGHETRVLETMTDPWLEWPGMKEVM